MSSLLRTMKRAQLRAAGRSRSPLEPQKNTRGKLKGPARQVYVPKRPVVTP